MDQQLRRQNEQLVRQVRRLTALNEIGTAVSGTHDFNTILQMAQEKLRLILPFDHFSVSVVDEDAHVTRTYGLLAREGTQNAEGCHFSLEEVESGQFERTGQSLILYDLQDIEGERDSRVDLLVEDGLRSMLSVPLRRNDELHGSLTIASQRPNAYCEEDIPLLQQVADHLSTALASARLLEQSQRRERQAEALYEASQLVTGVGGSLEEGMQSFFESLGALGDFDRWWLHLLDESGLALRGVAGHWGDVTDEELKRRVVLSEERRNPVAIAFLNQETVVINDPEHDDRVSDLPEHLRRSLGKCITEPLISKGQSVGVVSIGRPVTGEDITEEDIELVRTLASQVTLAVENARLFEDARRATQLLAERVQALDCLNDIGQRIDEVPPLPQFLEWVTERIRPVMQHPEHSVVAIAFDGQIYGDPRAADLPCQVVRRLSVAGERVGRLYVAYTKEYDFRDQESAMLGDIVRRISSYIENQRLLEQAETRVSREQSLRQIADRVQGLTDPEAVARVAVKELGTVLGRPAFIHVRGPEEASRGEQENGDNQAEASREGGE
ncbi:MAG: GAF domain-containing protein [Anaerolineae bacterium]